MHDIVLMITRINLVFDILLGIGHLHFQSQIRHTILHFLRQHIHISNDIDFQFVVLKILRRKILFTKPIDELLIQLQMLQLDGGIILLQNFLSL
jgi:hypothetical protein